MRSGPRSTRFCLITIQDLLLTRLYGNCFSRQLSPAAGADISGHVCICALVPTREGRSDRVTRVDAGPRRNLSPVHSSADFVAQSRRKTFATAALGRPVLSRAEFR